MAWPNYTKPGESLSALLMISDIVNTCRGRLQAPGLPPSEQYYYELVLGHAYLDRVNHNHGKLRTLVKEDGSGATSTGLDEAWGQVKAAYDRVSLLTPNITQLQQALDGIDHGGGGGGV
jgi:hypothetical protein